MMFIITLINLSGNAPCFYHTPFKFAPCSDEVEYSCKHFTNIEIFSHPVTCSLFNPLSHREHDEYKSINTDYSNRKYARTNCSDWYEVHEITKPGSKYPPVPHHIVDEIKNAIQRDHVTVLYVQNKQLKESFSREVFFLYHKIAIYSRHKTEFIFITFS